MSEPLITHPDPMAGLEDGARVAGITHHDRVLLSVAISMKRIADALNDMIEPDGEWSILTAIWEVAERIKPQVDS